MRCVALRCVTLHHITSRYEILDRVTAPTYEIQALLPVVNNDVSCSIEMDFSVNFLALCYGIPSTLSITKSALPTTIDLSAEITFKKKMVCADIRLNTKCVKPFKV